MLLRSILEPVRPKVSHFQCDNHKQDLVTYIFRPDLLNPMWKFLFGGCNLNRATDKWIIESFEWAETKGQSHGPHSMCSTVADAKWIGTHTEMDIDFENQGALDPKAYGWARKPSRQ